MPYEEKKDVVVVELGAVPKTDLHAEVRSYDGGAKKLCIYRMIGKKTPKRVQVFRLAYSDIAELGDFLVDFTATHGTGEATDADENEATP